MILPLTPRARAKIVSTQQSDSALAAYATKPVEFAADILGLRLTPDQELILDKLMHSAEVNVQSSHGQGKTLLASIAVLHHVFSIRGLAVTTAPTGRQTKELLWGEVRRLHAANQAKLGGICQTLSVKLNESARALGFSSQDTNENSAQGFHSEFLLICQDESCGISRAIDDGLSSCLTGEHNRILRIGNPVEAGTPFQAHCQRNHIRLEAWRHPNVSWAYCLSQDGIHRLKPEVRAAICNPDGTIKPGSEWSPEIPRDVIPGAVSVRWIESIRLKYGEGSVYWESRVEARFPTEVADGIIPLSLLLKARALYDSNPRYWDILALEYTWVLGVDVGDRLDRHAISLWRGSVLYQLKLYQVLGDDEDVMRLVDEIRKIVQRLGSARIVIDRVGVGAGVLAALKRDGYQVQGSAFGASAENQEEFKNRKAELYWRFRDGLRLGEIAIAPLGEVEEGVFEELRAIRYGTNTEKQIACEPKEKTKARLKRSPDAADAIVTALEIKPQGLNSASASLALCDETEEVFFGYPTDSDENPFDIYPG
jgi:hypothetical protein